MCVWGKTSSVVLFIMTDVCLDPCSAAVSPSPAEDEDLWKLPPWPTHWSSVRSLLWNISRRTVFGSYLSMLLFTLQRWETHLWLHVFVFPSQRRLSASSTSSSHIRWDIYEGSELHVWQSSRGERVKATATELLADTRHKQLTSTTR